MMWRLRKMRPYPKPPRNRPKCNRSAIIKAGDVILIATFLRRGCNTSCPTHLNQRTKPPNLSAISSRNTNAATRELADAGGQQLEGTVVAITADSVLLDIGYKSEGILPLAAFQSAGETVKPGDKFSVTVKGRDPEGYYELTRFKVARPTDWTALERAFAEKSTIVGTVTAMVKGGFSVDVGVRAFMPASRSGVREAAEMEKLVGQEIRCRITKLDVTEEDVVVDRRVVAGRRRALGQGAPLLRTSRRRHRDRHGSQPRRLRRVRRYRRRRWPAARRRHFVEPRQQTGRRAVGRAGDRSQGAQRSIPTSSAFRWA